MKASAPCIAAPFQTYLKSLLIARKTVVELGDHLRMCPAKAEDPRAWLRRKPMPPVEGPVEPKTGASTVRRSTGTLYKTTICQNTLMAVPYPHKLTGYKDPKDPCNRLDKHYGGGFRQFASAYNTDYAPIHEKPIRFREDGIPISARRMDGKPLMAPKLPNESDLATSERLTVEYEHKTRVVIGQLHKRDPRRFASVYKLVHTTPNRMLAQPNSGIAAEQAKLAHKQLAIFD